MEEKKEKDLKKDEPVKKTFSEWGGNFRGFNSKGKTVNIAEELNKKEKDKNV